MEIQYTISILSQKTVDEGYWMALKDEEKLMRKKSTRGKGTFQGRGSQGGREISTTPIYGANNKSIQHTPSDGDTRGRGIFYIGRECRGRGRELR